MGMKRVRLLIVVCFICGAMPYANAQRRSAQNKQPKDKVKATKVIRGHFVGFEVGDYIHAVIRKSDGKRVSYFLDSPDSIQYFLVTHKDQLLVLTYHVVDTYIPEAGGVETIEKLISVKAGNVTDRGWWKAERAKATIAQLKKKYDPLVQKATLN